jgi:hypothetical protein
MPMGASHHSQCSVILTAVGYSVGVRAAHQGRQRRVQAFPPADHVSRDINADLDPCFLVEKRAGSGRMEAGNVKGKPGLLFFFKFVF